MLLLNENDLQLPIPDVLIVSPLNELFERLCAWRNVNIILCEVVIGGSYAACCSGFDSGASVVSTTCSAVTKECVAQEDVAAAIAKGGL